MCAEGVDSVELVLWICKNVIYEWRPNMISLAGTEIVTIVISLVFKSSTK